MDDIKLALLGNRNAAKRLTDAGVVPYPECCNGCRWWGRHQKCSCCRRNTNLKDCYETDQNTRAPILSESDLSESDLSESELKKLKEAGPCLVTLDEVTEITQEQWEQLRSRIKRREADPC